MDGAITATGSFRHDSTVAPASALVLPQFSLKGRTAIVSGAGAGIGLAVAHALAEAGANVAIWYNSNKKAIAEAEKIAKTYGVTAKAYQVNVTSYDAVSAAVDAAIRDLNGRLDIFIANSGIPWTQGAAITGELEHYRKVVATDLDGTFYSARVAAIHWRRQKKEQTTIDGKPLEPAFREGSFVATASMSGHIVNIPQLQATYNAAKAGVIHLVKSLAVEWVGFARANTISPGYIATEISDFASAETKKIWKDKIPMGREGEVSELKGAFLYLSSDAASYTTGSDIIIDGGYCLP
ncbi:hypothetical protein QTJ16_006531 [Diplocarpon rosae]|uniref:L-xylulose reductase n=1 Tax=Diplocarpon rosae TaxID=946125 RepID=A0AAD9W9Z0_9HELO|nr:hypothetical protein QTJ16_006531 [Diplocarpon rosae]PBP27804.1 L-xylulose reductase [Diplocarpon rosae]